MRDRERIQKVEAVIITHRNYGEADRILKVLTPQLGKVSVLAKGVRKSGSRKAPHIEPFTHSALVLAKGQSFWILTEAYALDLYSGIYGDLRKTGYAAYLLELVDRLTVEAQQDSLVFRLALESLAQINLAEDPFIPALYFEIKILEAAGFRPDLFHCVSCKKEIVAEDQYFSIDQGGVICPACSPYHQRILPVTLNTLKILRHFERNGFKSLMKLKISDQQKTAIRRILEPYVTNISERKLNSSDFIVRINRLSDG